MTFLPNLLFAVLLVFTLGLFAFNLLKTWVVVNQGRGQEANRFDQPFSRLIEPASRRAPGPRSPPRVRLGWSCR